MSTIRQINTFMQQNPNLLGKALTSATSIGATFSPESLEKIVTDLTIKLKPELAVMKPLSIASKTHEFSQKTAKPTPGGAMGEFATTPTTNSRNSRETVDLKVIRRKGKVTNFLKDVSRELFDVSTYEMQNHLEAHVIDLVNYIAYGNADANSYEFDGWDKLITTNRSEQTFGGIVPTNLSLLDDMLDANIRKGGDPHDKVFWMSPEMLSKFTRFETSVRKQVDVIGGDQFGVIEVNGGWRLATYRGVPIIQTTSTRPIEIMRPTVTPAAVATGGSLTDGTYYFRVAPITPEGEQIAGSNSTAADVNVTLSAGTAVQSITLTLSDYHKDANGIANVYGYKIYADKGTGGSSLSLIKVVSAYTFDSDGTPTLNNGLTGNEITITSLTPGADVPTALQADRPLSPTGSSYPEVIALIDLDPIQGLGKLPYTNTGGSAYNGLVTTQDLAQTDDFIQFLVKSYTAVCPSYEATSYWVRGLRTA